MTAIVTSALLHKIDRNSGMDSRATTTIGSGSGDGVTGDVEVDVGMLPIRERRLNSVGEDCNSCASRPKVEVSGTSFRELVSSCYADVTSTACPYNVPIGCWDTSEVTDMGSTFFGKASFNSSINCWSVESVTDMEGMF